MKKRTENKRKKVKIPKFVMITLIIMASLALLSLVSGALKSSVSISGGNVEPEKLPTNLILDVDTNVKLHQNSYGAVYTKNMKNEFVYNEPVIYVTNQANGDYVSIELADASFKEFLESNHTHFKVSFDIVGLTDIAFPVMEITPVFSGNAPDLSKSFTKIAPISVSKFVVTAAYKLDGTVFQSFDTPGIHKFEYAFTKNDGNELSLTVSVDNVSETFVYNFSDYDFTLNSIKIDVSNNYTETTAVRIANVSAGYVSALTAAVPGENIVIPTDVLVTHLGNKTAPLYAALLHEGKMSLIDKSILRVEEGAPSNSYASIFLEQDNKSIKVFDYDYLTIDFDVSVSAGETPLACASYLLGRPGTVKQYYESDVYYCADKDENLIYSLNCKKMIMTDVVDTIHVRYVIRVNQEAGTADLQVLLNGVLSYNAPGTFNLTYNCIEEIRIKHFEAPGSISFTNLIVNGYASEITA